MNNCRHTGKLQAKIYRENINNKNGCHADFFSSGLNGQPEPTTGLANVRCGARMGGSGIRVLILHADRRAEFGP
jgi:hypothetical protein